MALSIPFVIHTFANESAADNTVVKEPLYMMFGVLAIAWDSLRFQQKPSYILACLVLLDVLRLLHEPLWDVPDISWAWLILQCASALPTGA